MIEHIEHFKNLGYAPQEKDLKVFFINNIKNDIDNKKINFEEAQTLINDLGTNRWKKWSPVKKILSRFRQEELPREVGRKVIMNNRNLKTKYERRCPPAIIERGDGDITKEKKAYYMFKDKDNKFNHSRMFLNLCNIKSKEARIKKILNSDIDLFMKAELFLFENKKILNMSSIQFKKFLDWYFKQLSEGKFGGLK